MKLRFNTSGLLSLVAVCGLLTLVSCNREGCTDSLATNYDDKADSDDGTCDYAVVAPDEYAFFDNEGNLTVSIDGQKQRQYMLSEMTSYMKSANTPGVAIDGSVLLSMYANDGYTWNDVENLVMTGSSKQLRSKTAGGDDTIISMFEGFMTDLAAASATTVADVTDGGAGTTGVVLSTTNASKQYLQNGQGQEWTQLIEKGLMGACFYYNISSVYLAPAKMDVDNEAIVEGKFYTTMEHHFDEAFGYFTMSADYPTTGTDKFWAKYAFELETSELQSASKLSAAFRLGRAAIVADDMTVRDQQIEVIREELELVAGGTAIHYLNGAIENFGDDALRNHELSEAKAFIMALPYGANTSVDLSASNTILSNLGDDFYNVTTGSITDARDAVAAALGISASIAEGL
ncbi:MAG: DUF4856 domain-containing protein [Candidatus Poseidoniaceae archaeon]|nr:DUF4856 domain-containing protein [Candidatus Poseidoniaceae archaeon]MDE0978921.1 DUF4856 domain-containing protein [Flavobacteriales bacterium]